MKYTRKRKIDIVMIQINVSKVMSINREWLEFNWRSLTNVN